MSIVQLVRWHHHNLSSTDLVCSALVVELLLSVDDKANVKIEMIMALKGKLLVVSVYQAYLLVLRFMVVDLIHGTKKLGEIFTKLIVLNGVCLVKNDHFASAARRDCLLE